MLIERDGQTANESQRLLFVRLKNFVRRNHANSGINSDALHVLLFKRIIFHLVKEKNEANINVIYTRSLIQFV